MKISFVIPCYRSEKTIEGVVAEIKSVVSRRPEVDYEIVMVSDHSPDNVYSVIERLCREDPLHLRGMELARNFGQHAALMAGYAKTTGDVVVSLDDDGQAPLEATLPMVDFMLADGHDVVIGKYPEKKHSFSRNLVSKLNDRMTIWLLDKPQNLQLTSFFVMKRFIVDEVASYCGPYPYIPGLMLRVTTSVANFNVKHRERQEGASGYTISKLIALWANGFTSFSVKPLRLAAWMGGVCALLGFIGIVYVIVNKIWLCPDVPLGYTSMMAALLFVGGLLMLILGLIGEYLGRIYICLNNAPQYVISKDSGTGGRK